MQSVLTRSMKASMKRAWLEKVAKDGLALKKARSPAVKNDRAVVLAAVNRHDE